MNLDRPIPTIEFPNINTYAISAVDEPLVSLKQAGFLCEPYYYNHGVAGSLKECYARLSVVDKLKEARLYLPENIDFKIYDAYRPIMVQQRLWDVERSRLFGLNPDLSSEELDKLVAFFVSKPSYDEMKPSLHNTGGSIDLTLINTRTYEELDMGTVFDDFSTRAWTNHFESDYKDGELNKVVSNNRRLLYNVMVEAGFTNLPSEWWHYDYGTKFWAHFKQVDSLYTGILHHPFDNVFPLI